VGTDYRNGFLAGCPRKISEAARDSLIESAIRLWLRKRIGLDAKEIIRRHGHPHDLKPRRLEIKDQTSLAASISRRDASCGIWRRSKRGCSSAARPISKGERRSRLGPMSISARPGL
jgi:hypothetical protein